MYFTKTPLATFCAELRYYNLDLGVHKNFALARRTPLQFRVEAFNALNHVNWRAANSTLGSGTFGELVPSNALPSRQIQLAIKVIR